MFTFDREIRLDAANGNICRTDLFQTVHYIEKLGHIADGVTVGK